MYADKLNIANLTSLWKRYGARQVAKSGSLSVFGNPSWPCRFWIEQDLTGGGQGEASLEVLLDVLPDSAIMPVWPFSVSGISGNKEISEEALSTALSARGFVGCFQQTAMVLPMTSAPVISDTAAKACELIRVDDHAALREWVEIGSEAFEYSIDLDVLKNLYADADVRMYLGRIEGRAVVSGLLFKTGDVVGIHQLGVKKSAQGKGLASAVMIQLLGICREWGALDVMLQASQAGRPLYDNLGFSEQFTISNYHRLSVC